MSGRALELLVNRLAPAALVAVLIAGCGASSVTAPPPTPSPTATTAAPTPTPTPTPTPSPTPTATPSPTPSPTASPSASPVAGGLTGRVAVADQGFAITLAPGWKSLAMTLDMEAISKLFPKGSQMATLLAGQVGQLAAAGVKFWAGDLRPKALTSGFLTNLNVIVTLDTGMGVDAMGAITAAQIQALAGVVGTVGNSTTTLPGGRAAKITYHLTMTIATGKKLDVAGTEYILTAGGHTYVFTFSCPYAQRAAYATVVTAMAKSIEFLP